MDFTPEETAQLVEVCKQLGAKPKFDSKEDFVNWMRDYVKSLDENETQAEANEGQEQKPDVSGGADVQPKKELLPKIPLFSGDPPVKSDHVPFEVWQFEVQCLITQKRFSQAAILNAARLSLRGDASKVAVRLGTDVTLTQLVTKMEHLYGVIDSGEDMLARFYSAT